MLLRLLLTSALGLYSELRSSSVIHPPISTISEILVRLTAILYSHIPTPLGAPCLSVLQVLGRPCLNSSYKSEPVPSDPLRTSILVRVMIRTLAIQLRSDICLGVRLDIRVSLHLTSLSPCLWGPLGPPSLSALQVPRGSEPLITPCHFGNIYTPTLCCNFGQYWCTVPFCQHTSKVPSPCLCSALAHFVI
jgi:hypothetical protein